MGRIWLLAAGLAASFLLYRMDATNKSARVAKEASSEVTSKTLSPGAKSSGAKQLYAGEKLKSTRSQGAEGLVKGPTSSSASQQTLSPPAYPANQSTTKNNRVSARSTRAGQLVAVSKGHTGALTSSAKQVPAERPGESLAMNRAPDAAMALVGVSAQTDHSRLTKGVTDSGAGFRDPKPAQLPSSVASSGITVGSYAISLGSLASSTHAVAGSEISRPTQSSGRSMHINRSLEIGLLAAPDYSDVHAAPNNKWSSNLGLTVGYSFLAHWSLNTGLIYTQKNYGVNEGDFKSISNAAYVPIGCEIEYVNGTCYMLEIPLAVRRDFRIGSKTNFFASAGLSSYIMQNEDYVVHYSSFASSWGVTSGQTTGQMAPNAKRDFWFSTASISAGFEQEISKGLSLQVEPFAKLPLRGIGMGNIQLSSYGIAFSIRYAPVLGRTRK
jgi:hypothetical protein